MSEEEPTCWKCKGMIEYYGARRMMCLTSGKIYYVKFGECVDCDTFNPTVEEVETSEEDLDKIEKRTESE